MMSAVKDLILIARDVGHIATDLIKVNADQIGTAYKKMLVNILTWLLVVLASLLLAVGGLGMILWGIYLRMSLAAGPVISALVLGVFLFFGATVLFLIARGMLKD